MEEFRRCPSCSKHLPSGMTFCPWDGEALDLAAPAKPADPLIETQVSEYVIKELIGSGGMGVVYRAVQPLIGKQVAIKVLKAEFSESEELVQRLLVEARAVNAVQHRGIIDIFGFGQLPDGRPYVVMELLHGRPLDVVIWERKKIPVNEAVLILDEMLAALGAAHRAGIVHRDLKPGNVFLQQMEDGSYAVKLLDFGIAKMAKNRSNSPLTLHGHILGTPEYMAPEQIRGKKVEPVTDLYAMGVITFQMITGRFPFTGEPTQVLFAQVEDEPPAMSSFVPDVPMEIEVLVQRLLAKDPAQRLQSAEEVRRELEPFLPRRVTTSMEFVRSDSGRTYSPTLMLGSSTLVHPPLAPLKRRQPWGFIALGVAALALLGSGLGFLMTRRRTPVVEAVAAVEVSPPTPPPREEPPPVPEQVPPTPSVVSQEPVTEEVVPTAPPEEESPAPPPERPPKNNGVRKPKSPRKSVAIVSPLFVPVLPTRAEQLQVCFSLDRFDRRTQQKELLLGRIDCLTARSRIDNAGQADASLVRELVRLRTAIQKQGTAGERMKLTLQLDDVQKLYDQKYGRLMP